ncbi:MAG: hypothetical protein CME06_04285 [Gemmatimonadetes bacterium]|nr:hypothetical protein [Gemmatimonadota bacterium]
MKARALASVWVLASSAPALDVGINCGGTEYQSHSGVTYEADRQFVPGDMGAEGGRPGPALSGSRIQHRFDSPLYARTRIAADAYIFDDLSNGWYVVTIAFAEVESQPPGARVFDLVIEGNTVLSGYDVHAEVGPNTPADWAFAVELTDGELRIDLAPSSGETTVSAVRITSVIPNGETPPSPANFNVHNGYGMAIIAWNPPDSPLVAAHNVYVADSAHGDYQLLAHIPHRTDHYYDRSAEPGRTNYYRVEAVDVFGNISEPSAPLAVTPLDLAATDLPRYELEVTQENLAGLIADPLSDEYVPAVFRHDGDTYDVDVRLRGGTTRGAPKRSWRVKFRPPYTFHDASVLLLSAEWTSTMLLNSDIAWNYFDATNVAHSNADLIHLELNGEYVGVSTEVESLDEEFLVKRGETIIGDLYKCASAMKKQSTMENWERFYEKKTNEDAPSTSVIDFVTAVNDTPDEEFAAFLDHTFDIDRFVDFYAVQNIASNFDFVKTNYYLYNDPDNGKWRILPWDLSAAFGYPEESVAIGSNENVLYRRFLSVPQFRLRYVVRALELMATAINDSIWRPRIEDRYDYVELDGELDIEKRYAHHNDVFVRAPITLPNALADRVAFMEVAAPAYAAEINWLLINEIVIDGLRARTTWSS